MKKILALLLAAAVLSLAACGGKSSSSSSQSSTSSTSSSSSQSSQSSTGSGASGSESADTTGLEDTMTAITEDAGIEYMTLNTPLTEENFSSYVFIDYIPGAVALASDAAIGSQAHSVVLVKLPDGSDAEAVRTEIESKIDPRKWICVEAEKTAVVRKDNLILIVMSDSAIVDKVVENFNNLGK